MALQCKVCKAEIPADQMDAAARLARCAACGAVFGLDGGATGPADAPTTTERHPRHAVAQPVGIQVETDAHTLRIEQRWYYHELLPIALACAFWSYCQYEIIVSALAENHPLTSLLAFAPLPFSGIFAYCVLAGLLNASHIEVHPEHLSMRHGPLPWPGGLGLPAAEVIQLYCKRYTHHGKRTQHHHYEVRMQLKDGADRKLLGGLQTAEQALYIEQEIEQRLGLTNRKVQSAFK